jgi:hypothetical protein
MSNGNKASSAGLPGVLCPPETYRGNREGHDRSHTKELIAFSWVSQSIPYVCRLAESDLSLFNVHVSARSAQGPRLHPQGIKTKDLCTYRRLSFARKHLPISSYIAVLSTAVILNASSHYCQLRLHCRSKYTRSTQQYRGTLITTKHYPNHSVHTQGSAQPPSSWTHGKLPTIGAPPLTAASLTARCYPRSTRAKTKSIASRSRNLEVKRKKNGQGVRGTSLCE